MDINNGISVNGAKPWYYPEISLFLTKILKNNIAIMGRITWNNLKTRPIPNCLNIVISQSCILNDMDKPYIILDSIDACINYFSIPINITKYSSMHKFIIGGKSIYEQFLMKNVIHDIYITRIKKDYNCNIHLQLDICNVDNIPFLKNNNPDLSFHKYQVLNTEETEIQKTMYYIIINGHKRTTINNNSTLCIFSKEFIFNVSKWHIPMSTLNPIKFYDIFCILIQMLQFQPAEVNNNIITFYSSESDTSRMVETPMNKGCFSQLKNIIGLLQNNPYNKPILLNLQNLTKLDIYEYQFYVNYNKISVKVNQKTVNMADWSYICSICVLLLFMLCYITDLEPGELIWSPNIIYINDGFDGKSFDFYIQDQRLSKPFPTLKCIKKPKNNNILNFEYTDFLLLNYVYII